MAVVLETTLGDITIDLYIDQRPKACLNFLKLCKIKYYNFNLFHTVNQGFIAQAGDPTGSRVGGESIWGVMEGPLRRYFEAENTPRIKHTTTGLVSFVGDKDSMIGSQFFITLAPDLTYLDAQHCVFGEVTEGFEILRQLNEAICDTDHRPYQDIRITHTVVLEDPFPDPENLKVPDGSPEPTAERLQGGRIAPDEEIDETEGKTVHEVQEIIAEKEAKARATILEMIGDIPDAEMAPPENVLFVCKLNPVTTDDDLEIIFSRFGKIKTCEVIRDKKSGDSLQYAFVEFTEQKSCEDAYFKMDNVLIDDRRIHVDFSQSVAKIKWHGKGRGVTHYNDKGEKQTDDPKNDMGNGRYRKKENRDSPKRNPERNEEKSKDKHENGNSRNRNDSRPPQNTRDRRDERYREDRFRQTDRNRYQDNYSRDRRNELEYRRDYRPENRIQHSRSRENERFRRNRSRSRDNQRFRQAERQYNRKDERSTSRSRQNQRFRPEETEYRRKQQKSRSRSRDNQRFRQRNASPDEKENRRREAEKQRQEKSKKIQEISSDEEPKKKNKTKKKRKDSSDDDSSSDDTPVKKSKKSKKKKSKKKKQAKSESDSDSSSSSEEERKRSKKKKKKSKKYESSSSDSDSDSDSDVPQKKKSKKR